MDVIHVILNYQFYSLKSLNSGKTEICLFDTFLQSQSIVYMSSLLSFFHKKRRVGIFFSIVLYSAGEEGMENGATHFSMGFKETGFTLT